MLEPSLAGASSRPYWLDRPGAPQASAPLERNDEADLVIVGAGFTGLWAAISAKDEDPTRDVVVVEARHVAFGGSGRNGGFVADSLTHGLAHGERLWPGELDELVVMGRANLAELAAFVASEGIDADLRMCGKSVVVTREHELGGLQRALSQHVRYGEDACLLDAGQARADVNSPTYLGALRVRSGGGLVDPARLAWGLASAARRRGVRFYEETPVTGLASRGAAVEVRTRTATITSRQVLLATNAFPPLLRRLRAWVIPVYDHVVVTEPLTQGQLDEVGWRDNQGMTDAGNQFHYYRRTPDNRILFGGYDAIYYFGNRTDQGREQRDASHALLASHFRATFPQLAGLGFTHRWAGVIDTTSRFTPMFGTAAGGKVAYALGYTGLGVASSRFGAQVALDLLANRPTRRTTLAATRSKPVPFPPEPLRYAAVQLTRRALAREDATGRRGLLLRTLDRFKVGFDS